MTDLPLVHARAAENQGRHAGVATSLFVRMWAAAHIIHLVAASGAALHTPASIAVVGLAFAVIIRPSNGRLLVAMMLLQLVDYVVEMPGSPDHWALILLVNLVILLTMAVKRSTGLPSVSAALPGVRAVVLVTYSFAAASKYNWHFLDPVTSCANAIAGRASFGMSAPVQDSLLLPLVSLAMETSVPLLLLLPFTRRHWVRVAMVFHFTLSASPAFSVVDFTSALFAIFVLFLSDEEIERILGTMRHVADKSAIARDIRRKPPLTAALAFAFYGCAGFAGAAVASSMIYLAAELYLVAILGVVLWTWRRPASTRRIGRPLWIHVPVLILAVLWASSPYLGLRTTGVFTMFSGVQTEGHHSNHLFLPTHYLTDWQEDMVLITGSNDPVLESSAKYELAVPLLALRQMAADDPDLTVTGRLHGAEVTFGPGAGQTAFEPVPYWKRTLVHFRPVPVGDVPFCSIS